MDVVVQDAVVITIALITSAFFSGMEIAFLSSNKLKLEMDKKQDTIFRGIANIFSKHPAEYMTTILIGNNIALVVYSLTMSSAISYLAKGSLGSYSMLVETLISTVIIIFFAEFVPKSIVKTNPNFYYKNLWFPVFIFYLIFYPISKLITGFSKAFMKLFGIKTPEASVKRAFDRGDLANLVEEIGVGADEVISENDKEMKIFQNALDFSDLRVRNCMIQRVDIEAVDIESTIMDVAQRFNETKFSRLPVYKESIDNIIGYVNIKELFKSPTSLKSMVIEPIYVPEAMAAQKLLTTLIKTRSSLAIVLDEFGGTAGMVTLEDVLEEIFGDIEDEYDSTDLIEREISKEEYLFSGRLEVDDLNLKYRLSIPESEDYETLAGYILFHNENLPNQGDKFDIGEWTFHILKMSSSKIELIKVIKIV